MVSLWFGNIRYQLLSGASNLNSCISTFIRSNYCQCTVCTPIRKCYPFILVTDMWTTYFHGVTCLPSVCGLLQVSSRSTAQFGSYPLQWTFPSHCNIWISTERPLIPGHKMEWQERNGLAWIRPAICSHKKWPRLMCWQRIWFISSSRDSQSCEKIWFTNNTFCTFNTERGTGIFCVRVSAERGKCLWNIGPSGLGWYLSHTVAIVSSWFNTRERLWY